MPKPTRHQALMSGNAAGHNGFPRRYPSWCWSQYMKDAYDQGYNLALKSKPIFPDADPVLKSTPAPWKVRNVLLSQEPWELSAVTTQDEDVFICDVKSFNEDLHGAGPANARLIASSPDLFKALLKLVNTVAVGATLSEIEQAQGKEVAAAAEHAVNVLHTAAGLDK